MSNKLYIAAGTGNLDAVQQQLAAGADINKPGAYKQTPLFIAAMKGHTAVVDVLLKAGANKEKANVNQATPLYIAAASGYIDVVNRLLAAGANKEASNIKHATPLFVAAFKGHDAIVQRLLAAGTNKDKPNINQATPLFVAAENGHAAIVDMLLAANVNKDKANVNQATPLFIAAANGHTRIVERLLAAGANKDKPNTFLQTPLIIAAINGHKDSVIALLKAGADPNKRDKSGLTALQLAKKSERTDIVEIFAPSPKWKGWSRSDIEQLNTLFETQPDPRTKHIPAEDVSLCPVCLKTIVRGEACMYMSHKCTDLPGYYHEELYKKYKNESGRITWCTICNRICNGHRHYAIVPANAPKGEILKPSSGDANPFGGEKDCKKYGGGGREEKITRIRRLREYAFELNQDIGKIPEKTAINYLVEEMWNSPFYRTRKVQTILETGKWNISNTDFPAAALPQTHAADAPDVPWPFAQKKNMMPILNPNGGMNNISMMDVPVLIQLVHRQENGSIKVHDQTISIHSLFDALSTFGGSGTPEFGKCFFGDGCTGIHYPGELQYILDHYPAEHLTAEDREKYQQLVSNYKTRFNEAYRDIPTFKSRIDTNIRTAATAGGRRRKTWRRRGRVARTTRRRARL
jgi:ankyrin repeat protein